MFWHNNSFLYEKRLLGILCTKASYILYNSCDFWNFVIVLPNFFSLVWSLEYNVVCSCDMMLLDIQLCYFLKFVDMYSYIFLCNLIETHSSLWPDMIDVSFNGTHQSQTHRDKFSIQYPDNSVVHSS